MIGLVLLCSLALVGAVSAIPVSVTRVEIDDHEIAQDQSTRLDVQRDNKVDFKVFLESNQDMKDVELQVFVSGFEHNVDVPLSDRVGPFDMDANVTYKKSLAITFPDLVQEDNYKVRVVVTDRDGKEVVQNYNVKMDFNGRHDVKIVDALFTPSRRVQAGQALLTVVRVKNFGEKDEKNVKVTAAVPQLTLSTSGYIDSVKSEQQKETEELYLKVPKCTAAGVYDMTLQVAYNDGFSRTAAQGQIEVLEDPACAPKNETVATPPAAPANDTVEAVPRTSKVRTALEVILLVLVALLVIIGLIIGFSKMGASAE